jgi:putative NADH-flavin reductase
MQAAVEAGLGRVVFISSSGIDPKPGDPWWFEQIVKPLFLKQMYDDMRRMEQQVTTSATSWTIGRPPQLVDGTWTGVYRTVRNGIIPNDGNVSRGDLAHFILDELEQAAYLNAKVDVSY